MIAQLEADLAKASGPGLPVETAQAPLLQTFVPSAESSATDQIKESVPTTSKRTADDGLLPVVTAQRDRLKKQNLDLEQKLHDAQQHVRRVRTQLETVQSDRSDLASKLRCAVKVH